MVGSKKFSELQLFFIQNGRHIAIIASLPNFNKKIFLEAFCKLLPCHENIITAIKLHCVPGVQYVKQRKCVPSENECPQSSCEHEMFPTLPYFSLNLTTDSRLNNIFQHNLIQ